jgi:alkaline phosphatase D
MDRRDFLKTVAAVSAAGAVGAFGRPTAAAAQQAARYDRTLPEGWTYPVDPALLPFGHGVMSGDPLADRVILWTRITIPDARGWDAEQVPDPQGIEQVSVRWVLARDPELGDVVRRGEVTTSAERDWTVKVDADELPSATTLFYAFEALGYRSPIGRARTAPAAGDAVTELTIAHVACTSWWQDVFNAYARIGERNDLDLVTHAGDHVYESSGGHPASRFWADQRDWENDLDNRPWTTLGECRRRYALYYQDPPLLRAHLAAPFAVIGDNHDYDAIEVDGVEVVSREQASQVFYEWTAARAPLPDGSGRFPASPGPDVNVPVPRGDAALFGYRSLPYGALAEIVLIDVRRFAEREGEDSQVLGDTQWAWLEQVLLDTKRRDVVFRYVVNQVNFSQLRAFNLPAASTFEQEFGMNPNASDGEVYAVAWGANPDERARLCRFLRDNEIVDNVIVSGDSHGFFGSDVIEDNQAPNYNPLDGGGLLGAVGVEMVPMTMGRPGLQDVLAEAAYFATMNGSRGAAFEDAATFDAVYRPAVLPATLDVELAGRAANPNLQYFNWKSEFGHTMVHLRPERAVLECFTSPQREPSESQRLLAQFSSPVGAPHLGQVLSPEPVEGSRQDPPPPAAQTTESRRGGGPPAGRGESGDRPAETSASRDAGSSRAESRADSRSTVRVDTRATDALPATGGAPVLGAAGIAAGAAALAASRRLTHDGPAEDGQPADE